MERNSGQRGSRELRSEERKDKKNLINNFGEDDW